MVLEQQHEHVIIQPLNGSGVNPVILEQQHEHMAIRPLNGIGGYSVIEQK